MGLFKTLKNLLTVEDNDNLLNNSELAFLEINEFRILNDCLNILSKSTNPDTIERRKALANECLAKIENYYSYDNVAELYNSYFKESLESTKQRINKSSTKQLSIDTISSLQSEFQFLKLQLNELSKTKSISNIKKRTACANHSIKNIETYYYSYSNIKESYILFFGEEIKSTKQRVAEYTSIIPKEEKTNIQPIKVKNKIISQKNVARIIDDIVSYEYLIWIKNGEHQNYSPTLDKNNPWEKLGISINIGIRYAEPSAIDVTLPVAEIEQDKSINIQYYPSYQSLTPECRRTYLNWIQSGFKDKIAVGYVFLYYYGLERFLLEETHWENAFYEIIRIAIEYPKIANYCKDAVTFIALINNRLDLLDILKNNNLISYPIIAYLEYKGTQKINSDTLYNCISVTNIVPNKRYYKMCPEIFYEAYVEFVKTTFGESFIPLPKIDLHSLNTVNVFVNSSINNNVSLCEVPNIFIDEQIEYFLGQLFLKVHEKVKKSLAEKRKK